MQRTDRRQCVRRVPVIRREVGGFVPSSARFLRQTGGAAGTRVWLFILLLAIGAIAIYLGPLAGVKPPRQPIGIPWPVVSLGFFLAELKVVDVHFRREKHSFSLSEFPAVLGLFLLSPQDYLLAMLIGSGSALVYFRQPP